MGFEPSVVISNSGNCHIWWGCYWMNGERTFGFCALCRVATGEVWPFSSSFLLCVLPLLLASADCQCSQHTCLCCQRHPVPSSSHGEFVSIWIGFWEAAEYLIKKASRHRKTVQFNFLLFQGTSEAACRRGKCQSFSEKVVEVFVVESVMCLILKCAYQVFPLIENENSCRKIPKYKFYLS